MATLNAILTGTPGQPPTYSVGMAETFSWVPIDNDANRPLFARAGYITNLKDLTVSLSASDVTIGAVEIKDGNSGARADVVSLGDGLNGLCIRTQNVVSVSGSVTMLNPVTAVTVTNQITSVQATVTNPVTALTVTNQITSVNATITNVSALTSVSSTLTKPVTGNVGVAKSSNWGVTYVEFLSSSYAQFPSNTATVFSYVNNTGGAVYIGKWNNSSTIGMPLSAGASIDITLTGNTNEVGIKSTASSTLTAYAMFTNWN
jgi:hypothetical protein